MTKKSHKKLWRIKHTLLEKVRKISPDCEIFSEEGGNLK